jgi:hypothetical protein
MKKILLITCVVFVGALVLAWQYRFRTVAHPAALVSESGTLKKLPTETVTIGAATVEAEIARTPADRAQGLSDHEALASDSGMLFMFDVPGNYNFWMYRMRFPLDFVWIRDGKVVALTENVPTPTAIPNIFNAGNEIDAALELNAGWVAAHRITVGMTVGYGR